MVYVYLLTVLLLVLGSLGTRRIDLSGALGGGIITFLLLMGTGWLGMYLIGGFFITGTLASVWKLKEKEQQGLAEKNQSRRGIANVLANALVPGICGLVAWLFPEFQPLSEVMAAAAFASATSDTLSSELGNMYGSRYVNILTLRNGERGRDGMVSLEGTLFGVGGSIFITLIYSILRSFSWDCLIIFVAGIMGNLLDSVLGASLQHRGYLNNHMVNFVNTLFAAILAFSLYYIFR